MSSKREKLARIGMFTKGVVYAIIGVLTAMAAFNLGGSLSGKDSVLEFLASQSYGQVLLSALALGLFAYAFYRLYEAFAAGDEGWDEMKGFVKRTGYVISGLLYGLIGYTAAQMVLGSSDGGGGKSMVDRVLEKPFGEYLLGFVALCLIGKGFFQWYKAYSGKFREDVKESSLDQKEQQVLLRSGTIGFTARGVVAVILGFLLFKIILGTRESVDGKVAAFEFLQNTFGATVMGIVALGLVAYAVFMFIQSKYAEIRF
ncbi:DUF1206 domain-containing protein [Croceiramulus getboli]|nr:DUF1206 domain-containing protein [Flavobacteriaceae bacterium YJPT1-3]